MLSNLGFYDWRSEKSWFCWAGQDFGTAQENYYKSVTVKDRAAIPWNNSLQTAFEISTVVNGASCMWLF